MYETILMTQSYRIPLLSLIKGATLWFDDVHVAPKVKPKCFKSVVCNLCLSTATKATQEILCGLTQLWIHTSFYQLMEIIWILLSDLET